MSYKPGHWWVNQRFFSWKMLPGMAREVWRWERGGELGGFATKAGLCLCLLALLARDITDCVLCQAVQETFVVIRWKKRKG